MDQILLISCLRRRGLTDMEIQKHMLAKGYLQRSVTRDLKRPMLTPRWKAHSPRSPCKGFSGHQQRELFPSTT